MELGFTFMLATHVHLFSHTSTLSFSHTHCVHTGTGRIDAAVHQSRDKAPREDRHGRVRNSLAWRARVRRWVRVALGQIR